MRKSIYVLLLACALSGCNDFLEESSQNEIHPSTVSDMEKLLEGEAYFTADEGSLYAEVTDIFTDNITNLRITDVSYLNEKQRLRYRYLWDLTMWDDNGYQSDISIWQKPYERIKGCNVILEYADAMDGDKDKREHLKGEAYFLRGFYYFYLTNFFGKPYNECDPETDLAVPLKLETGVTDEKFHRNTVKECYDQILADLQKGSEMMREHLDAQSTKLTRANYLTGYAMLSRVYLYMEDWDNTIRYADSVISQKDELYSMEEGGGKIFTSSGNVETLWLTLHSATKGSYGSRYPYPLSQDLISVYSEDKTSEAVDLRNGGNSCLSNYLEWGYHFETDEDGNYLYSGYECYGISKGMVSGSDAYTGMRVSEVYLNRAEAYLRKYMAGEGIDYALLALDDLNKVRQNRFQAAGYEDKTLGDFSGDEALWSFYQRERRRELCGEGNHRWFDLRRLGMPQITHIWVDNDNGSETEHVLEQGDSRYVLPVPEDVILRNPNL